MIAFFNKLGNSWIAKIICAVLAISMMAFWGLGGISMTAGSDNTAAKVGRQKISMQQLHMAFEAQRNKISQLTGKYISQKQAIENGILDQVVQQVVDENLQNQLHEKIGLTASDKAVRKYVETNPLFQDNLGHFDTNMFYAYLGQLKMNQEQLADKLKTELANQHMTNALLKSTPRADELIKLTAQSQKETRNISYVILKQSDIAVDTPDTAELKEYYEAYQDEFTTPEYRKIHLMSIVPADFKGDKETAYDRMYKATQDLEDLLGAGTSLKEAAQKLNLPAPVELIVDISGKNKQGVLADKKLQENTLLQEAFILNENEATSLIDYDNGYIVAELKEVIPVAFKPFESVQGEVLALYKQEQQKEKLPKIVEKLTQSLTSGKGWGHYTAQTKSIQRTEAGALFKQHLDAIFAQGKGNKNVGIYPIQNGTLFVVVDDVILNRSEPKAEEQKEALKIWSQDLANAVQGTYMEKYPVQINQESIRKNYSNSLKEED